LFKEEIFDLVLPKDKIVLSGDINKCSFKNRILNTKFKTKIFFSALGNFTFKLLQKYEGFFVSDDLKGITKVIFR
jgi:hypothetical protein